MSCNRRCNHLQPFPTSFLRRMPPVSDEQGLPRYIVAYLNQDYAAASEQALDLLRSQSSLMHLQLLLISLQRLGEKEKVARLGTKALAEAEGHPWDQTLLRLTLGQLDPSEVLQQASTNEQRCQGIYYASALAETAGEMQVAEHLRMLCCQLGANCYELRLAQSETKVRESPGTSARLVETEIKSSTEGSERQAPLTSLAELHESSLHQQVIDLNRQVVQLLHQGRYSQALPVATEAFNLACQLGTTHPDFAESLNNLGGLCYEMGDYAGATTQFRRALEIRRAVLGPNHPDFATSLGNVAGLHIAMSNYAEAEPLLRQAVDIDRQALGGNHPDLAIDLDNLGALYLAMGNYVQAEALFREAMEIFRAAGGKDHPEFATCLHNLAMLYRNMGNYAQAEPLFRQALDIRRNSLGEDHSHFAQSLNELAHLCIAKKGIVEALSLMTQAAATDDRRLGQIFSIGSEREQRVFLASVQWKEHALLSLIVHYLGHSQEAARTALDLVLRRKAVSTEALAIQRDAVLGGKYPALQVPLRQLSSLRIQIARKTLAGAGAEGLRSHQEQIADWTREKWQLESALVRQIPEMNLEQRLRQADRNAVAASLSEKVALVEFVRYDVCDFKATARRVSDTRWLSPQHRQPARYLAFVLPAGKPDDVQMIDLGAADSIDLLIADFRSSITGDVETQTGRSMVKQRPNLAATSRTETGSKLRAAVFDALAPALTGCQRLLLAPDGALTRLPFEVLPSADGRLLLDAYQISYVGTGRDVLRFGAATTGRPTDSLVIADPDFDLDTETADRRAASSQPKKRFWSRMFGRQPTPTPPLPTSTTVADATGRRSRDLRRGKYHFGRLPGTHCEGERIAAMLCVQPWMERAALEGRLKQQCRSPHILHIATHGFFLEDQHHYPNNDRRDLGFITDATEGRLSGPLPENPLLRAGLALAGANTWLHEGALPPEAEDGLLTAEDVSGLDLLATELVVLSACDTGLGEVRTGEGVFGLQRAFVLAGAKTLVMSLWSVPDDQTRELMEDFYQRILSGQPRADALRAAQLALRVKYPDPYYWGAFICQGDPGPLRCTVQSGT
jgi:CHAT domain-containing protein/tetratricopeptide (TPR) repeat protein